MKIKSLSLSIAPAYVLALFFACVLIGCAPEATSTIPPPPDRIETTGASPGADYYWMSGYWWPHGAGYDWHPGKWEYIPPHETVLIQKTTWELRNGVYYFHKGGWDYLVW